MGKYALFGFLHRLLNMPPSITPEVLKDLAVCSHRCWGAHLDHKVDRSYNGDVQMDNDNNLT